MIINGDNKYLLYIEPKDIRSATPLVDELTKRMTAALRKAKAGQCFMGFHTCNCGAHSSSCDFILPSGVQTNSLCIHYLAYHRPEVPRIELSKVLLNTTEEEAIPTEHELTGK
jgi:hypothetical protein